jgi:probable rRNA maturation factor
VRPSGHTFNISISAATGREISPYVRRKLLLAHKLLKSPLRHLSLALVGDTTMSRLHQEFMGIPGPTDVLSFPLENDARGRCVEGELVICIPEARRQSRLRGIPLADEVLLYALHGMLHLGGWDDRTEAEYRAMHAKEDQLLQKLGIGRVFDRTKPTKTAGGNKR